MNTLIFDIETNGLLNHLTKIHSLVIYDLENNQYFSCADEPNYYSISFGVNLLQNADCIVGHNIIKFDIPAIQKLFPDFDPKNKIFDTLIASKLVYPDISLIDMGLARKGKLPSKLIGSFKLEAFGFRLGELKGEYCKQENAWEAWNLAMQEYCKQDVKVTTVLYEKLKTKNIRENVLADEQKFAKIIGRQEQRGVHFNQEKAIELAAILIKEQQNLEFELNKAFPPKKVVKLIPKRDNSKKGYIKGEPVYTYVAFNPSSRQMVAERLIEKYDWQPKIYTPKGQPKVSAEILDTLEFKEAPILKDYFDITKTLGQIKDGENAWLKCVGCDSAIHGGVDTTGTVTYRCTHFAPNLAQTPAVEKDKDDNILMGLKGGFGYECRELFEARQGFKLVGCDASALELRNLAHYMNDPDYIHEILNGDIHTKNQIAAGIDTRSHAKTFIYCFLYGGGAEEIGIKAGITEQDKEKYAKDKRRKQVAEQLIRAGKNPSKKTITACLKGMDTKAKFLKNLPALKTLLNRVKAKVKQKGYLLGIDKRVLKVREQYKALNVLLQSAGAIVMKKALCILYDDCVQRGWIKDTWYLSPDDKVYFVLNIHDEYQAEVKPEIVDEYSKLAVQAIEKASKVLNYRCPLTGEAKVGSNWAETH